MFSFLSWRGGIPSYGNQGWVNSAVACVCKDGRLSLTFKSDAHDHACIPLACLIFLMSSPKTAPSCSSFRRKLFFIAPEREGRCQAPLIHTLCPWVAKSSQTPPETPQPFYRPVPAEQWMKMGDELQQWPSFLPAFIILKAAGRYFISNVLSGFFSPLSTYIQFNSLFILSTAELYQSHGHIILQRPFNICFIFAFM